MRLLDPDSFKSPGNNTGSLLILSTLFVVCFLCKLPAYCFPEFQAYSEKHSGKSVDCAMCHVHADGPVGEQFGQLGSLSAADMEKVNQVRAAIAPGVKADSPILNKFGNEIIRSLGVLKFVTLKSDPSKLASALGKDSDLDGDGIPDSIEYLDGTDPLSKFSGNPSLLFINNFNSNRYHILLAILAIALLSYGIVTVLKVFTPPED